MLAPAMVASNTLAADRPDPEPRWELFLATRQQLVKLLMKFGLLESQGGVL